MSLDTAAFSTQPVMAADPVRWNKINIPTEGEAGDWVLSEGSDIRHLTEASDGTLYAYGKGLTYTLYRSTGSGVSWSHIGNVQDAIAGIAIPPNDATTIYYATSSSVFRSTNGGKSFYSLPSLGGAGSNNLEITSIDVACLNNNIIAIGTRDTDSLEFGGVYILDEKDIVPGWADTDLGNYDVYAVAFSPNYAADRQLVAVITDENDTLVTNKIGDAGWGATIGNARLNKDNSGTPASVAVANSAAIAFPADYDYDTNCIQFIAIDTGTGEGDVYKVTCTEAPAPSLATDLNTGYGYGLNNIDVTGLAAGGSIPEVHLLAGAAGSAQTYFSDDGGKSWKRSHKEPTGGNRTYVLMERLNNTGRAYAVTSGDESAFSVSQDNGDTWNQVSLIDTGIGTIVDMAPSPTYSQDNTLFILTFGGEYSLWRSLNGGNTWQRILASTLSDIDSVKLVGLPPQYGENNQTVFIAGESDGRPVIWKSTDNGHGFRRQFTSDPVTADPVSINTWAIVDDTTLFVGSYDGSNGLVYLTTNSGLSFSEGTTIGSQSLNSIDISPEYGQDGTVLIGNTGGWVYRSDDNGASFAPLPSDATSPPLTGPVDVTFDPEFASNKTVYATTSTVDRGVYRFIIGNSSDWENIDGTLPGGAMLNRLTVSRDGVLYAANSDADGGMERCLNPTFSLNPTFETVTRGLSDGAILSGLWQSDHNLWTIDTANTRLLTFNDTLISPLTLTSPGNEASGSGNLIDHTIRNVSLDWETLDGATSYQWQLNYDTDFSSIPGEFDDNTEASSIRLPSLEPATTYYWRVRASAPALSPWSNKWSFTTSLDTEAIALRLESPLAGAGDVPVKPLFQWTAVVGADAYELLVSADADFSHPVIIKQDDYALAATAWQSNLSLDYDTTYYWKVRGISASSRSAWSAAGAFTTEPSPPPIPVTPPKTTLTSPEETRTRIPAPTTSLTPLPTPPTSMQVKPSPTQEAPSVPAIAQSALPPAWAFYLIGALLLVVILALVIILTLILVMRRLS